MITELRAAAAATAGCDVDVELRAAGDPALGALAAAVQRHLSALYPATGPCAPTLARVTRLTSGTQRATLRFPGDVEATASALAGCPAAPGGDLAERIAQEFPVVEPKIPTGPFSY